MEIRWRLAILSICFCALAMHARQHASHRPEWLKILVSAGVGARLRRAR
jgi:hypothetical protein